MSFILLSWWAALAPAKRRERVKAENFIVSERREEF